MKTGRQEDKTIVCHGWHSCGTDGEASYFFNLTKRKYSCQLKNNIGTHTLSCWFADIHKVSPYRQMIIKLGSVFAAPESVTYYKAGYGEAFHLQVVHKWKGFLCKDRFITYYKSVERAWYIVRDGEHHSQ